MMLKNSMSNLTEKQQSESNCHRLSVNAPTIEIKIENMKKSKVEKKAGSTREEYIKVESKVYLHVTDAGEGRPVVLIHGWPLSDEMYEYQYNDLIKNRFHVIGITLRGFGQSSKPYGLYDYDVHAKDIKKVLDHLDIKKAVLGGFSMGGSIAIRYISLFKSAHVSKLALFGAAAPIWTQRKDFPYNLEKSAVDALIALNYKDRPKLISDFTKIFSATPTSLNKGIGNWLNWICLSASSFATAQSLIALRDTDLRKDLEKIKIPTLIMHGKQDKICSFDLAEQMKAGISDSKLIPFENSGHSLFLEETEKFNAALIKFAGK
jgi:pimeloyl-ACP methyl ester carboxylesterase